MLTRVLRQIARRVDLHYSTVARRLKQLGAKRRSTMMGEELDPRLAKPLTVEELEKGEAPAEGEQEPPESTAEAAAEPAKKRHRIDSADETPPRIPPRPACDVPFI